MPQISESRLRAARPAASQTAGPQAPEPEAPGPRVRAPGETAAAPWSRARRTLPWQLAALFFALYSALAIRDQQRMLTTGYDLGIFDQAVRSYAHGHLPIVPLKGPGFDLLGDHFSPILATLAPLYRLWPSPYTLLLAQAALLAVSVVPLTRWAAARLGARAAAVVGVCYGASWGIASADGFDFHEIAFAVPLLAFAATALGERRLRAAAAWALPLLLVKEDLGLTVAVVGILIAVRGGRRLGLATAAAGIAGTLLEITVVIPAINPRGYQYLGFLTGPAGSAGGSGDVAGASLHTLFGLEPQTKLMTLFLLLAPTAFLALRSSLAWLLLPTLLWRFTADNQVYWGTSFQYSAVLMPIVFAAYVEALSARRASGPHGAPRGIWGPLAVGAAVTAFLAPSYPLAALAHPGTWSDPPRLAAARRMLALIPDGARVEASDQLVPQLTDRTTVTLFGIDPANIAGADWIIVDTRTVCFPASGAKLAALVSDAEHDGHRLVAQDDGYLVLERTG